MCTAHLLVISSRLEGNAYYVALCLMEGLFLRLFRKTDDKLRMIFSWHEYFGPKMYHTELSQSRVLLRRNNVDSYSLWNRSLFDERFPSHKIGAAHIPTY